MPDKKAKKDAPKAPAPPDEIPTAETYDPERHANHSHLNP